MKADTNPPSKTTESHQIRVSHPETVSAYEAALRNAGFLAMGGQTVNATVVAAPKQRNTEAEKAEL